MPSPRPDRVRVLVQRPRRTALALQALRGRGCHPPQKSFQLSMATTKALSAYREKMRKCVLLCANCHGEVEAGLIPSPPAGSKFSGSASDGQ